MSHTRRSFFKKIASAAVTLASMVFVESRQAFAEIKYRFGESLEEANIISYKAHEKIMSMPGIEMHGNEKIAMLTYPGMTALDLVGPQYFFSALMGAEVHIVSQDKELKPIQTDTGLSIMPTTHLSDCPIDLDVLFIPGGTTGTVEAMKNTEILDFISERKETTKFITSVCTGSMVLGQAGLLKGIKATSHWATHHLLPDFGAIPVNTRVVHDKNILTGAGVSAGLDFALTLVELLRGRKYAEALQLQAEYAPHPPFNSGSIQTADPELKETMHQMFAAPLFHMKKTIESKSSSN